MVLPPHHLPPTRCSTHYRAPPGRGAVALGVHGYCVESVPLARGRSGVTEVSNSTPIVSYCWRAPVYRLSPVVTLRYVVARPLLGRAGVLPPAPRSAPSLTSYRRLGSTVESGCLAACRRVAPSWRGDRTAHIRWLAYLRPRASPVRRGVATRGVVDAGLGWQQAWPDVRASP